MRPARGPQPPAAAMVVGGVSPGGGGITRLELWRQMTWARTFSLVIAFALPGCGVLEEIKTPDSCFAFVVSLFLVAPVGAALMATLQRLPDMVERRLAQRPRRRRGPIFAMPKETRGLDEHRESGEGAARDRSSEVREAAGEVRSGGLEEVVGTELLGEVRKIIEEELEQEKRDGHGLGERRNLERG